MSAGMGSYKGSTKKGARITGQGTDYFNVTTAGGQFNILNQNGAGPAQKTNPKAITKSNFYSGAFQNTLGGPPP
jgi:hypothetical protein